MQGDKNRQKHMENCNRGGGEAGGLGDLGQAIVYERKGENMSLGAK